MQTLPGSGEGSGQVDMLTGMISRLQAVLHPTAPDPVEQWTRTVRIKEAERQRAQRQVAEIQEICSDVLRSCPKLEGISLFSLLSQGPRKSLEKTLKALERKLGAAQNAEAAARRNLSNARLSAGCKAGFSSDLPG